MASSYGIDLNQPSFRDLAESYAEGIGRLVFWGGAGLSVEAGLPSWIGLRDILVKSAISKIRTLDETPRKNATARINSASQQQSLWESFEILWRELGDASFSDEIRRAFQGADSREVPSFYRHVWRLDIDGLISLNIDGLAGRGFAEQIRRTPVEFDGIGCGPWLSVLQKRKPFIVTLHGRLGNPRSWVLRRSDIERLQKSPEYQFLIRNIFGSRTVVFAGLSATDRAAGGLLEQIARQGIVVGTHFWITSETGSDIDSWAESTGIRIIRYRANNNNEHTRALTSFLRELERRRPSPEVDASPVASPAPTLVDQILPPDDLSKEAPENIRLQLNGAAVRILETDRPPYPEFQKFCQIYQRAVHYSWHVSLDDPDNVLFGFRIIEVLGSGAFGKVFKAVDPTGRVVAIKLLREEVRTDQSMLGSFRRGVRSMKILSKNNVEGMVPYYQAYELPPCVIMEYIEGETLESVVSYRRISGIEECAMIAYKVAVIVDRAHRLPEIVLHRDLRPSNIMIRNSHTADARCYDVVVLDFDLSWHKTALEKSITTQASAALGYLAPEQLSPDGRYSSRHSAVDSYGLAMTIYYMLSGRQPIAGEAQAPEWKGKVYQSARSLALGVWKCVPERLSRLVIRASVADQSVRPVFPKVLSELEVLDSLCRGAGDTDDAEIWAEELFVRAFEGRPYEWDDATCSLSAQFASGVKMILASDQPKSRVTLSIDYSFTGAEKFRNVSRYLPQSLDKSVAILRSLGWTIDASRRSGQEAHIRSHIEVTMLAGSRDQQSRGLVEVGTLFEFE